MSGIGVGTGVTDVNRVALVFNMGGGQRRQIQVSVVTTPGRSVALGSRQAPLLLELAEDGAAPGRGT